MKICKIWCFVYVEITFYKEVKTVKRCWISHSSGLTPVDYFMFKYLDLDITNLYVDIYYDTWQLIINTFTLNTLSTFCCYTLTLAGFRQHLPTPSSSLRCLIDRGAVGGASWCRSRRLFAADRNSRRRRRRTEQEFDGSFKAGLRRTEEDPVWTWTFKNLCWTVTAAGVLLVSGFYRFFYLSPLLHTERVSTRQWIM